MYFTRILLSIVFVLFASTALAAKPDKTLVCHVGNEVGPGGEDYLDDPGCVPIEENEYFCPDAGKIDLIEVAKPDKHLDNDSHSYDGISDYLPGDIDASGEGKEDSNGDGVDDGCEPRTLLACPCWNTFTESELAAAMNAGAAPVRPRCMVTAEEVAALDLETSTPAMIASTIASNVPSCLLRLPTIYTGALTVTLEEGWRCVAEATAVTALITWCPDP